MRKIINHLQIEEHQSKGIVPTPQNASRMNQSVKISSKGTIQPLSSLGNDVRKVLWNLSFAFCRFDKRQMPLRSSLGNQLKGQDAVSSEEHVLLENAHSLNTLFAKLLCENNISVEILFQWAAHDGSVSVCRECA